MPKSKIIVALGIIVALMPVLGFPSAWESVLQVAIGVSLVLLSVWANIDRRLTLKAKAHKRQMHKRKEAELGAANKVLSESLESQEQKMGDNESI